MKEASLQIILENRNYIALRHRDGNVYYINCKVALIAFNKRTPAINGISSYVSYNPVSFMDYITNKLPIM
jgi:hypothetical protein